MNFYIIQNELYQLWRHSGKVFVSQGFSILVVGFFSFILHDLLLLYPEIGSSFYWFAQSFSILFLSDRIFRKDFLLGFISNVLNSETSLSSFLFSRWIVFTVFLTVCMGLSAPLLLGLLSIPFEKWGRFLLLLFPFNGVVGGYGGMFSLFIQSSRSYLLPFLLFPFLLPVFIFTIAGVSNENFVVPFLILIAFLFCTLPFILGISNLALRYLNENH